MAPWTLREILEATGAAPPSSALEGELVCGKISSDTRDLPEGSLFVPLVGDNFDGHDFVGAALAGGARLALWHRPGELPEQLAAARVLRCPDTLAAYQALGRYHLKQRLGIPVVAVTGSTGKTTTKDLVAGLLASRLKVYKTPGNFNNDIGVPKTLLELEADHQAVVLEMGMRGPGQIRRLARLVEPQVGLITNIGLSHIELLGSQENIAHAKGELLEELAVGGTSVLPGEDPFFALLASKARGPVCSYAPTPGGGADICPEQVTNLGLEGWELVYAGRRLSFPLPGEHLLADLMGAIGACRVLGLEAEALAEAVPALRLSAMRMDMERTPTGTLVLNDAYNAAPDSMRGALQVLGQAPGRKVAVLGDMLELGPVEDEAHLQVGEYAASFGVDLLVAVGPRSAATAQRARERGVAQVHWAQDTDGARSLLADLVKPGDTVLLKASRGMGLDRLKGALA